MVKQRLSFLKIAVKGIFQLFDFSGNEVIVSEVGMGNGVVSERVFEKGNSRVVEDKVGKFMSGERGVRERTVVGGGSRHVNICLLS